MFVVNTMSVLLQGPARLVHGEFEQDKDKQSKSASCQPEKKQMRGTEITLDLAGKRRGV